MQTSVLVFACLLCAASLIQNSISDPTELSLTQAFMMHRLRATGLGAASSRVILMLLRDECVRLLVKGGISSLPDHCYFVLSHGG
ncbi:hypothetical protein BsWGS_04685 [Bradybaena similaris]